MSELSQKCDYPSLILPDLIRCFKSEFLSTVWIIISKILFETQQSDAVSTFAQLFQTDQIVIF